MKKLIFLLFVLSFSNCSGQNNFFWSYNNVGTTTAPTVTTTAISAITSTTATSGGNVTSDGGASVTGRGIVWGTTTNPTIASCAGIAQDYAPGTGSFSSSIILLSGSTTYYVRAYAANSVGTSYGDNISFTTEVYFDISFTVTRLHTWYNLIRTQCEVDITYQNRLPDAVTVHITSHQYSGGSTFDWGDHVVNPGSGTIYLADDSAYSLYTGSYAYFVITSTGVAIETTPQPIYEQ